MNNEHKLKKAYQKFATDMMNGKISMDARDKIRCMLNEKLIDEYMKECGVTTREEIDWSNPHIMLMDLLNDPLNNHIIMYGTPEQKQSVYDQMTPEMLDLYWNYVDENGCKYCDKETHTGRKNAKKVYKSKSK